LKILQGSKMLRFTEAGGKFKYAKIKIQACRKLRMWKFEDPRNTSYKDFKIRKVERIKILIDNLIDNLKGRGLHPDKVLILVQGCREFVNSAVPWQQQRLGSLNFKIRFSSFLNF